MNGWYEVKLLIQHATGVSMDALHVLAGVLLQLSFAALTRLPLKAWRPWLFLLALALLNEAGDLWVERWPEPAMQYGEGIKDVGSFNEGSKDRFRACTLIVSNQSHVEGVPQ